MDRPVGIRGEHAGQAPVVDDHPRRRLQGFPEPVLVAGQEGAGAEEFPVDVADLQAQAPLDGHLQEGPQDTAPAFPGMRLEVVAAGAPEPVDAVGEAEEFILVEAQEGRIPAQGQHHVGLEKVAVGHDADVRAEPVDRLAQAPADLFRREPPGPEGQDLDRERRRAVQHPARPSVVEPRHDQPDLPAETLEAEGHVGGIDARPPLRGPVEQQVHHRDPGHPGFSPFVTFLGPAGLPGCGGGRDGPRRPTRCPTSPAAASGGARNTRLALGQGAVTPHPPRAGAGAMVADDPLPVNCRLGRCQGGRPASGQADCRRGPGPSDRRCRPLLRRDPFPSLPSTSLRPAILTM